MSIFKCKMCGGDLELTPGQSVAECEYCGSRQTVPAADNDKKMTLFARANRLRAACEFDKAAGIYETIVADFPEESEAYWGLVLCKYGIEYVDDPATGKKIPTCHRSSFDSVLEDTNLDQALENADVIAQKVYREEAKQFERIRKGILEVSSTEKPYDIFICYKETDEKGDRTLDSVLAQDLYTALTDKGYRVFFSRVTLRGKLGEAFEPYIFAALNSAKVMLAVGTCYEYYNAVWVKNEWSRYLKICEADKSRHLIPCYKDLEPEDMPREFSHLQGADLGKMGAIQDILFNMEKYIPLQKQTVIQEKVVVGGAGGNNKIASLLDRGNMALEDGDWNKAMSFFEDVLNNDSKNAQAYLGETLAQEKCRTMDAFARKRKEATLAATGETLKLEPNSAHVAEMAEKYQIPGYCEPHAIRKLYDFDLSYHSDVAERKTQYHAEERYWDNHKQLSRAEKFATGEVAETLQREKQALFSALKERVTKAQQAEDKEIARIKEAYAAHIRQADEKAEALYQNAVALRERNYQSWLAQAKTENDVRKLRDLAQNFASLNGYADSNALGEYCHNRADEEQAKIDAEKERLAEGRRKEAERIAKRNKRIAVICTAVAAVALAAILVVTKIIVPNTKYNDAVALMEAGQYEEAIAAFEELGGYKDSALQVYEAKYCLAISYLSDENYNMAIVTFEEVADYKDSMSLINESQCLWAIADMENGKCDEDTQMLLSYNSDEFYIANLDRCYLIALKLFDFKEYSLAKHYFDLCNSYEESKNYSNYCAGKLYAAEENWSRAAYVFSSTQGFLDSDTELSNAYYQHVVTCDKMELDDAIVTLNKMPEQTKDSNELLKRCIELQKCIGDYVRYRQRNGMGSISDVTKDSWTLHLDIYLVQGEAYMKPSGRYYSNDFANVQEGKVEDYNSGEYMFRAYNKVVGNLNQIRFSSSKVQIVNWGDDNERGWGFWLERVG